MAQDIFLQSQSSSSRRYAVLEDDGRTAYLYLTEAGSAKPMRDAVAYSRAKPVEKVDWDRVKRTGGPPPLTSAVASPAAVLASPKASEFAFQWSRDGESVALMRNGVPLALVSSRDELGYAKAVSKPSRLANPWSEQRFVEFLGE